MVSYSFYCCCYVCFQKIIYEKFFIKKKQSISPLEKKKWINDKKKEEIKYIEIFALIKILKPSHDF